MIETYNTLALISGILACVMLIVTALLFFKFNIPKLIGDLTGKNAKKAIEEINKGSRLERLQQKALTPVGTETHKRNSHFSGSGHLKLFKTGELEISEDLIQKPSVVAWSETNRAPESFAGQTTNLVPEETTVPHPAEPLPASPRPVVNQNETTVLQKTEVIKVSSGLVSYPPETTVLKKSETLPFSAQQPFIRAEEAASFGRFVIEVDTILISTSEVI